MEHLKEIARQWDEAFASNDATAIMQFMAEDWIIVGENGPTPKMEFMEPIIIGALTHTRMDTDEIQVKQYGDMAIIIGKGTSTGVYYGQAFHLYDGLQIFFLKGMADGNVC